MAIDPVLAVGPHLDDEGVADAARELLDIVHRFAAKDDRITALKFMHDDRPARIGRRESSAAMTRQALAQLDGKGEGRADVDVAGVGEVASRGVFVELDAPH